MIAVSDCVVEPDAEVIESGNDVSAGRAELGADRLLYQCSLAKCCLRGRHAANGKTLSHNGIEVGGACVNDAWIGKDPHQRQNQQHSGDGRENEQHEKCRSVGIGVHTADIKRILAIFIFELNTSDEVDRESRKRTHPESEVSFRSSDQLLPDLENDATLGLQCSSLQCSDFGRQIQITSYTASDDWKPSPVRSNDRKHPQSEHTHSIDENIGQAGRKRSIDGDRF